MVASFPREVGRSVASPDRTLPIRLNTLRFRPTLPARCSRRRRLRASSTASRAAFCSS